MSDGATAVAQHWGLLATLGGVIITMWGFGRSFKKGLREEIHEGVILALNNGAGEILHEKIELALAKAFKDHTIACPLREPMAEIRGRVRELEDV
jgi:hypothetical protein